VLAVVAISFATAGCREPPGAAFACTCTVLTDFDDASTQATRVCGSSVERAAVIARSCAREEGAPAPVQACFCAPEPSRSPAPACRVGTCLPGSR
jgi:hypothetical protein